MKYLLLSIRNEEAMPGNGREEKQINTNPAPNNVKGYSGDHRVFAFRTKDSPVQIGCKLEVIGCSSNI